MASAPTNRDIIVIGASSGGVEALKVLMHGLRPDLPASVFLVMHVGAVSHLAEILKRKSGIPVVSATDGARIERGQAYVAVPGVHLLLHDDHILLRRGPRENLAIPAIDPLFRSAAASFGGRVIGVVLSGALADGTAGLRAIKRCGGLAVVQDPHDALAPGMPSSALRHVEVDQMSPIEGMAERLASLARLPAGPTPAIPLDIRLEAAIAAQELSDMKVDDMLGTPSRFTCPECHGSLWEIEDGSMLRYRCHVGHAFTADTVLASQGSETERLLGTLLRSHQERVSLTYRMAEHERANDHLAAARHLEGRAHEYEHDVAIIRKLIRESGPVAATEGSVADYESEER